MKDTQLRIERDRDIFETYKRGMRTRQFTSVFDAAAWVMNQPAQKFYMSSKSLAEYLGVIFSGKELTGLNSYTKEKVYDLFWLYCQFLAEHPDTSLSRSRICEIIVDYPAPKFYYGKRYTYLIITREIKRNQDEVAKRLGR